MDDQGSDGNTSIVVPKITILSDHPILREDDKRSHLEMERDGFLLDAKLGALFDILRHKNTRTPITAAIYGDWGTGKSSSMRWLKDRLGHWNRMSKEQRGSHPSVESVWFEPWKYHTRESVWRGLISEVILHCFRVETMTRDNAVTRLREASKHFGRFLGRSFLHALTRVKVPGEDLSGEVFSDVIDEYNKANHPEKAYLNEFESTLKEWVGNFFPSSTNDTPGTRLAVFIDDLDRCLPEVTLEVLEALKLYINIPQMIVPSNN